MPQSENYPEQQVRQTNLQPQTSEQVVDRTPIEGPKINPAPVQPDSLSEAGAKEPQSDTNEDKVDVDKKATTNEDKKSGWLGGWFGGKKKEVPPPKDGDVTVHKAKLGEGMSLVYDPVTKKWTNPKGVMPDEGKAAAAPPPPMAKKTPAISAPASIATKSATPLPPMSPSSEPVAELPSPAQTAGPPRPGPIPRKLPNADDDLAAMLGPPPASRRAASTGTPGPPGMGSVRAKKSKPAKRYVDVLQETT